MARHALAALTLPAALLAACTTLSPAQRAAVCEATDWSTYGYNDGVLGVPGTQRARKFADCAELGRPADIQAYWAAHDRGLRQYCTVENGYEVGYSGRPYHGACPRDLAVGFLQGYEQGRKDRPTPPPSFHFGVGVGHYWHHHSIFDRHRHY